MAPTVDPKGETAQPQHDREIGSWQDLIERLAVHDIHYLMGDGSRDEPPLRGETPLGRLYLDLAHSDHARLRDAIIALLLRHPEHARHAEMAARELPVDDPTRRLLLVSVVVAAALQREWSFTLDLYLPDKTRIAADQLARELDLPRPTEDYGRPCIASAAKLLRQDAQFPFNYEVGWEDAARRLRAQLIQDARHATT